MSANFSSDGSWLETETLIPVSELPAKVSSYCSATFPGWKLIEANKIETLKNGIFYEADLKQGKKRKEITLNPDGIPVK